MKTHTNGQDGLSTRRSPKPKSGSGRKDQATSGAGVNMGRNKLLTQQRLRALVEGIRASLRSSAEERRRRMQDYGFIDGAASRNTPLKPKQLRELGLTVRPVVREMVVSLRDLLQRYGFADVNEMLRLSDMSREAAEALYAMMVPVPALVVAEVAALLATIPQTGSLGPRLTWSKDKAQRLLNKGMSKREISKRLASPDVSPESIRRRLSKMRAQKSPS
jgi:hypothetical protein